MNSHNVHNTTINDVYKTVKMSTQNIYNTVINVHDNTKSTVSRKVKMPCQSHSTVSKMETATPSKISTKQLSKSTSPVRHAYNTVNGIHNSVSNVSSIAINIFKAVKMLTTLSAVSTIQSRVSAALQQCFQNSQNVDNIVS